MLRTAATALVLLAISTSGASAKIDAMNYCPHNIPVAVDGMQFEPGAFTIGHARLEPGPIAPGAKLATVETRDLQPRTVISADSQLGLRPGDALTPVWAIDYTDVFQRRDIEYCSTPPSGAHGWAICVGIDANGQGHGGHAQFDGSSTRLRWFPGFPGVSGLVQLSPLDAPSNMRALVLTSISSGPVAAVYGWPAYTGVTAHFALEGAPPFRRSVGDPLPVEGGVLVIMDVDAAGAATVQQMSRQEWTTFSQGKCAEALAPK